MPEIRWMLLFLSFYRKSNGPGGIFDCKKFLDGLSLMRRQVYWQASKELMIDDAAQQG